MPAQEATQNCFLAPELDFSFAERLPNYYTKSWQTRNHQGLRGSPRCNHSGETLTRGSQIHWVQPPWL